MGNDEIQTGMIRTIRVMVDIQDNGIIRDTNEGWILGRVNYKGPSAIDHLDNTATLSILGTEPAHDDPLADKWHSKELEKEYLRGYSDGKLNGMSLFATAKPAQNARLKPLNYDDANPCTSCGCNDPADCGECEYVGADTSIASGGQSQCRTTERRRIRNARKMYCMREHRRP